MNPAERSQPEIPPFRDQLAMHTSSLAEIRRGMEQMAVHHSTEQQALGQQMASMATQIQTLGEQLATLTARILPPVPVAAPVVQAPAAGESNFVATGAPSTGVLNRPELFSGDSGDVRGFLTKCSLHFELNSAAFPTERTRVAYIISLLCGRAEAWATMEWRQRSPICDSVNDFARSLECIFQRVPPGREATRSLLRLRQGSQHASDFAIQFRIMAAESRWDDATLTEIFIEALAPRIRAHLIPLDLPNTLNEVIALVTRIENRQRTEEARNRGSAQRSGADQPQTQHTSPLPEAAERSEESMQVGRTRLPRQERERRMENRLCLYCGAAGHRVFDCPLKEKARS